MARHPEHGQDSTGDLLMAVTKGLRRRYMEAMLQWEVTPAQGRALRVVHADPGIRLSALAEALRIAPRSATEVVDALEARGLVTRTADPDDRRATRLSATAEGERLHGLIAAARERESAAYLEALGPDDRDRLHALLRKLVDATE